MTTWPDVFVALAGAPVGAAIAVLGVWLTNKHNDQTHKEMLDSQERQQTERLEFELKSEHLRQTLAKRSEIYEDLLEMCDLAIFFAAWGDANELPDSSAPLANEDLVDMKDALPTLGYSVDVHCSAEIRAEMAHFSDALEDVDEASTSPEWTELMERVRNLRTAVIDAAVSDRTSGLTHDGMGGM